MCPSWSQCQGRGVGILVVLAQLYLQIISLNLDKGASNLVALPRLRGQGRGVSLCNRLSSATDCVLACPDGKT